MTTLSLTTHKAAGLEWPHMAKFKPTPPQPKITPQRPSHQHKQLP